MFSFATEAEKRRRGDAMPKSGKPDLRSGDRNKKTRYKPDRIMDHDDAN